MQKCAADLPARAGCALAGATEPEEWEAERPPWDLEKAGTNKIRKEKAQQEAQSRCGESFQVLGPV